MLAFVFIDRTPASSKWEATGVDTTPTGIEPVITTKLSYDTSS